MTKRKGTALIAIGLLLMAAALLLTVYNMQTELQAAESSARVLGQLEGKRVLHETLVATGTDATPAPQTEPTIEPQTLPEYVRFPEMEMPSVKVEEYAYIGKLRIPSLGLELPVMSDWSYPQLKIAPCRFSGSAYQKNLIIIAHNYASHFGNLKNLQPGDEITFTDMAGNVFCYAVAETEILQPHQIEELQGTDYPLTLLTCTLGGETRVTVRCEQKADVPAQ